MAARPQERHEWVSRREPPERARSAIASAGLAVVRLRPEAGSLPLEAFVLDLDQAASERVRAAVLSARGRPPRRDLVLDIDHLATDEARAEIERIARALAPLGVPVAARALALAAPARAEARDPFGFRPRFRAYWVSRLRFLFERYLRITVSGIEHVPARGPAVIAANHAGAIPIDAFMLGMALELSHPAPRPLRVLYDRFVDGLPWVGEVYRRFGGVTASFENGLALLRRGDLVGVFPEGIAGTEKRWTQRYLVRRFRSGAARLAIRTGAPLVPVAITGAAGAYPVLFCSRVLGEPLGLPWLPVTPLFPHFGLVGALPLPTRCHIHFCPPLDVGPADDADDAARVALVTNRLRQTVTAALCEQVEAASRLERLAVDLTAVHPSRSFVDDE
jgi:1-acyl-sn-glycerol-3-phosphate acyltransferase